jgi:hypothetical protein
MRQALSVTVKGESACRVRRPGSPWLKLSPGSRLSETLWGGLSSFVASDQGCQGGARLAGVSPGWSKMNSLPKVPFGAYDMLRRCVRWMGRAWM